MACCRCCCGGEDCDEGQAGKCCCGGPSGTCCQEGEYCCSGVCQEEECEAETGACCVYEDQSDEDGGLWAFVSCTDTTADECTAGEGQYASFKPGVSCSDDPDPCEGDPGGTCCTEGDGCINGGPGFECYPTGSPDDDGCYCDDLCYTQCFDCCGADARECCTPKPEISSLWDDTAGPGAQMLAVGVLGDNLSQYDIDINEAWHAAMQSGAVFDGYYQTHGFARVSLLLCLQDMSDGAANWVAQQQHRDRVTQAATEIRRAGQ